MSWAYRDGPEFFRLLHAVKYEGRWGVLEALRAPWLEAARTLCENHRRVRIVPIPDDPTRRRSRGGSTVEWLCACLADAGIGAVELRALVRRRPSPPQARIESAARRRQNVRTLFGVGSLASLPRDALLLVVDDQITTGATVDEAVALLRRRGHRIAVLGLAGARAAPHWLDP